jgi:hypothetical protein
LEQAMLRRLVCACAIVPLIAGAAAAQDLSIPFQRKSAPPSQEQIDRQKAADKAYEAAIHKLPDKKSSADPWGDVRPAAKSKQ